MSAYSLVSHRMFVAALSNNPGPAARPEDSAGAGPVRSTAKPNAGSAWRMPGARTPRAGTLLANAMMQGYHPAAT